MKEVEIISKVVGRTGTGAVGVPSVGGIPSVDLSGYLLKKVWDEAFELKETTDGTPYLYGKLPVVVQYGITMYGEGGNVDIPSIYAGLPIDGTTIYWDGGVLKAQGGGSGGGITDITSSMVVSALGYTPAKASDLTTLQSTVNDFLSGSDTDTIINKWKELEVFLSGLSESENLATILGTKADKATTLAGYGITDAYTKSDVNTLLGNYVTLAGTQTITGEKDFTGGLKVNGSPIVYDATNKYWKLEGDLLVTGGVTMYGNDSAFTPSSIMDAIVADGTNLKVIDGVLTFVGETGGGLTEVNWDDVIGRPTLLSSFTNDKGYIDQNGVFNIDLFDSTSGKIGLPAAGTFAYTTSTEAEGSLNTKKSFIGTVLNENTSIWYSIISVRHRNGAGDGNKYGLYIGSRLLGNSDLFWNKQTGYNTWQGERVILDSHNWSQYVTANDGGNYLPLTGGTLTGSINAPVYELSNGNCIATDGVDNIYLFVNGKIPLVACSSSVRPGVNNTTCSLGTSLYPWYGVHTSNDVVLYSSSGDSPSLTFLRGAGTGDSYNDTRLLNRNGALIIEFDTTGTGWVTSIQIDRLGGLLAFGGITMYSDIRKKTKLQDVELSLSQIANAPLIEHYYNSDDKRTTHVGSIAQYWAGLNDWFCKQDQDGFYTMEIQNAALASAISVARHLQKYETKTDRTIRKLKKRISELEDEIEKLKSA